MKRRQSAALTIVIVVGCAMLLSSEPLAAQWFRQQGPKLVGSASIGDADQGGSVALSADGNTAIVGGTFDDGGIGAAWVWTRTGTNWTQGAKLVGSGATGQARQGSAVSISADGNSAVIGGPRDDGGIGAAWVWTRSGGVWTQQGSKLVGSGAVGSAGQGGSVSISGDGNTVIVGGAGDNGGNGAAWVWKRVGGAWTQEGPKLVGSGSVGAAAEGCSVSLSGDGNTAIVGGRQDNGFAGAAWVWTRSGGAWSQHGPKLVGSGAVGSFGGAAEQGSSVAISADGNTALVGGAGDDADAGAAWVWKRYPLAWSQEGEKLVASDMVRKSDQGQSVALSADGTTALIGADIDNNGTGASWIWMRGGPSYAPKWTQQGTKLVGSSAAGLARQGSSVALSADGRTAMVGGPGDDAAGAAWVFVASPDLSITKSVVEEPPPIPGADLRYAISVTNNGPGAATAVVVTDVLPAATTFVSATPSQGSCSGASTVSCMLGALDKAATATIALWLKTGPTPGEISNTATVAAAEVDANPANNSSTVILPDPALPHFSQQGPKLVATGAAGTAQQGYSVALSADGNTAVVGGQSDGNFKGAAWVWTRTAGVWTQQGSKLVGSDAIGSSGQGVSVAVSADGNTVIVGGDGDNGYVGAAWVWTRSGGVWSQQGPKLVGSGAVGNARQGGAVAISADGNTAIVGGALDNNYAGAVWVWTRSGGVWSQQGPKLVGRLAEPQPLVTAIPTRSLRERGRSIQTEALGPAGAEQGYSVDLSGDGNSALVGGPYDLSGGAAWIWTRIAATWTQLGGKIVSPPSTAPVGRGMSVALSGDGTTAMIGAPGDGSGTVLVWTSGQLQTLTGTEGGHADFGQSVDLSADGATAIVGTPGNGGGAWPWMRRGGVWTQAQRKLVGSDGIGAEQGYQVALSADGNTVILGGRLDNGGVGAVWIFAAADLTVTLSHSGNFRQGDTGATYTITVTNSGPATTSGIVTVTDTLPQGITPVGPIGAVAGWDCAINGQMLNCTRSDLLASGASYPAITLTVKVAPNAPAGVINAVTVSGGGEMSAGNDSASDPTIVAPLPTADIAIAQSVAGGPLFVAGDNLSYTITVSNGGPNDATAVVVTDLVPGGSSLVSAVPSQGSCSGTVSVACALGALASGSSATITLVLTSSSTPGTVSNAATVSAAEADPNAANNSSTMNTVTVRAAAIPAMSDAVLILLAGLLALLAAVRTRT